MAGLMSRASLVVKSKLSKLLDRAEDPGETLDYSYEKQLELLQNVKRGIADVVTAKKRLELQEAQLQQSLVKLDAQAREALAAGREDLARQALERKSGLQQQLQSLDQQTEQLEQQQEKLVASEKALSAKVEAFRTQKETIKAQYSAAEAQVRIGEASTGIGEQMADTGLAIQRAKDKTELPGSARFGEVRVEGRRPADRGVVMIYFAPGQADRAYVPIVDGNNLYTIVLEPFTGRAKVAVGKVEVPD
jgi:phage shock protein A